MKNQVSEKTMARLLKVFELHNRGVGGEKENATVLLARLLKENKMTMADLEEGYEPQWYSFPCGNVHDRRIIEQVIFKVLNAQNISYRFDHGPNRPRSYEMTPAQYAEASVMISLYRRDLKKHIEQSVAAFITANRIFPETGSSEQREYTEEEKEEIREMLAMAEAIKPTQINKQIGAE